jgi:tetratricopeptide (TPR) repeat protein
LEGSPRHGGGPYDGWSIYQLPSVSKLQVPATFGSFIPAFRHRPTALGGALVDKLVDIISKLAEKVPEIWAFPSLVLMLLLVVVCLVLRSETLNLLDRKTRVELIRFIVRYGFAGTAAVCAFYFGYLSLTIRSASAEVEKGIVKQGTPSTSSTSSPKAAQQSAQQGAPTPIIASDSTDALARSLVMLSYRLRPPPGIDDALNQLKAGNSKPAIDILNNDVLARQTADKDRAATLRKIGLLEFFKDTAASLAIYRQAAELDPDNWEAWGQIANLLERTGNHAEAADAAKKAIDIAQKSNDAKGLGIGYAALGYIAASQGDNSAAITALQKARGNFLTSDAKQEYAEATNNLGRVNFAKGELDTAQRNFEEALQFNLDIRNERGKAADYIGLANVAQERGREKNEFGKALEYYEKAMAANDGVGDPHLAAMILSGKCMLYLSRNEDSDLAKARESCGGALNLEKQIDHPAAQVFILGKLAEVERMDGQLDAAETKYLDAIGAAKAYNLQSQRAALYRGLGMLYHGREKWVPALDAFRSALALDQMPNAQLQRYIPFDQSWIGTVYDAMGQRADACTIWKTAADNFSAVGDQENLADTKAEIEAKCGS